MYDIGELLKTRRADLGISSQEKAAVAMGTTKNTWSKWEQGHELPSARWVEPLAEFLDAPRWKVLAALGLLDDEAATVLAEHLGGYPHVAAAA